MDFGVYDFLKNILNSTATVMSTLLAIVIAVVAWYKLFEKAGVEGWKAFIPFYNLWCYYKIATNGENTGLWFFGSLLLGWIPGIGALIAGVTHLYISYNFAKRYTNNTLLIILNLIPITSPIVLLILAFGDYRPTVRMI